MSYLFKEKSHLMVKFMVNQVAMSLFGLMMSATAIAIGDSALLPFGVFGLLFFYFILFTFIREDGLKDAIKTEGGRIKEDIFCSVKYCSVASFPSVVIALAYIVLRLTGGRGPMIDSALDILNIICRIVTFGSYNSIDRYISIKNSNYSAFSNSGFAFILYAFLTIIVCFIAYYSGIKKIGVKEKNK